MSTHRSSPKTAETRSRRRRGAPRFVVICGAWALALLSGYGYSEPVQVLHPQGWAHGFVEVSTVEGRRIGIGDLVQRLSRGVVTSRLVLKFFDGSIDDETTVYTQNHVFRL